MLGCFLVAFIEAAFFGVASVSVHFFEAMSSKEFMVCIAAVLTLGSFRFFTTYKAFKYFYGLGATVTDILLVGYKFLPFLKKTTMLGEGGVSLFSEKSHSLISGFFVPLFSVFSGVITILGLSLIEVLLLGPSFLIFASCAVSFYGALFFGLKKRLDESGKLIVTTEFEVSAFATSFVRGFKVLHSLPLNRLVDRFHDINSSLQMNRAKVNFFGQFSRLSLELVAPIGLVLIIFLTTSSAQLTDPSYLIDSVVGLVILQRLIPLGHQVSVGLTSLRSAMWNVREFTSIGVQMRSGASAEENRGSLAVQQLDQVTLDKVRTSWMPASVRLSGRFCRGDVVVITGASGVGKTSFLDIFALLNRDFVGTITCSGSWGECDYTELDSAVAMYCTQDYVMFNGSVRDNLELVSSGGALSPRQSEVFSALNLANNASFLNQDVSFLSGGEQQRVALARIFFDPAPILVLDEPSSGLDASAASGLAQLIVELDRRHIVFVASHDRDFIKMLRQRPVKEVKIDSCL